jgi:hypothetical protein
MNNIIEAKEKLRKILLDLYQEEYNEYAVNRRNLETKAQGNVAIAGIFIAGLFAFITKTDYHPNHIESFLLLLVLVFLVSSIIFSVLVLQTGRVPIPPLGSFAGYSVKRLLQIDETDFDERLRRFSGDRIYIWRTVIDKIDKGVKVKAKRLWIAQVLLMAAILSVALLAIIEVVNKNV